MRVVRGDPEVAVGRLRAGRQRREHRGTAELVFEQARGFEQRVADLLGVQALARKRPQQLVARIDLLRVGARRRRLAVGRRQQDLALQFLDAPAVLHELGREVVQQLGVGRLDAHLAEVADRFDDAVAEHLRPLAVDEHARGERVVGRGDPVRDRGAAAGRGGGRHDLGLRVRQQRRKARLDLVELAVEDALEQHVGRRRIGVAQLAHRGDVAGILRLERVEGLQLLVQRLVLRVAVLVLALELGDGVARAARQRPQVAVVDPAVVGIAFRLGLGDGRARVGHEAGQAVAFQLLDDGPEQGVLLRADVLGRLFPLRLLRAVRGERGAVQRLDVVVPARVHEEGLELVVLLLRDLVELVVVALRAAERGAEEDRADRVGEVVGDLLLLQVQVARVDLVGEVAQEAGGHQRLAPVGPEFVAGDLFLDEAVERLVLVERGDHVVAVAPDVGPRAVGVVAVRVRVARQVQPAPALALAVVGRREQAVDELLVGLGRLVADEGLDLLGRRDQAPGVQRRAPDEGGAVGLGRGLQALFLQLGEHEGVDGRVHPAPGLDGRDGRRLDGRVGPRAGDGRARRGGGGEDGAGVGRQRGMEGRQRGRGGAGARCIGGGDAGDDEAQGEEGGGDGFVHGATRCR